jgi:hypothetical protein
MVVICDIFPLCRPTVYSYTDILAEANLACIPGHLYHQEA